MAPSLTLISSVPGRGQYGFPHDVAQALIREALESTTSGQPRKSDADLSIFYTADVDDAPRHRRLGTVGVAIRRGDWDLWRFGDRPSEQVDLARARHWVK
jgi:hypothetical protein